ncbi:hypothetical protein B9Z55_028741 [Caenorhabditis nigoni]|uniref:Uncharacterized protein n=1 Tax=Caenorhabditis nigoni TaxID=1611254 RepID=A0A2G5SA57_9PELO|nr:hypothetical protein B9Z55_028741 [Caenorhabditis nigoni]
MGEVRIICRLHQTTTDVETSKLRMAKGQHERRRKERVCGLDSGQGWCAIGSFKDSKEQGNEKFDEDFF